MTRQSPPRCPVCGACDAWPIGYGLPWPMPPESSLVRCQHGHTVVRRPRRAVLGGCCIGPDMPRWHCERCGHDFGRLGSLRHRDSGSCGDGLPASNPHKGGRARRG